MSGVTQRHQCVGQVELHWAEMTNVTTAVATSIQAFRIAGRFMRVSLPFCGVNDVVTVGYVTFARWRFREVVLRSSRRGIAECLGEAYLLDIDNEPNGFAIKLQPNEDDLMQVLCKASNTASDIRCSICGQGFLVYFTRTSAQERDQRRSEVQKALREHHLTSNHLSAHPAQAFNLPAWSGAPEFSAAALLGGAPEWAVS